MLNACLRSLAALRGLLLNSAFQMINSYYICDTAKGHAKLHKNQDTQGPPYLFILDIVFLTSVHRQHIYLVHAAGKRMKNN